MAKAKKGKPKSAEKVESKPNLSKGRSKPLVYGPIHKRGDKVPESPKPKKN